MNFVNHDRISFTCEHCKFINIFFQHFYNFQTQFYLATINGKFAVECILLGIECFDSKKNQRTVFISTDAVISFRMPRDTRARARALHYSDFSNIFNHTARCGRFPAISAMSLNHAILSMSSVSTVI